MLHKAPLRELGNKTAARYFLASVTMAITKQSAHKERRKARACMKHDLLPCFEEWMQATATMENSEEVLETLKTELPHDLAIPPMDLQAKENHNLKRHLFPKVHCSTMGNASNRKLPGQMPREDVSIGTMGGTSGKQKPAASSDDLRDTVLIPRSG